MARRQCPCGYTLNNLGRCSDENCSFGRGLPPRPGAPAFISNSSYRPRVIQSTRLPVTRPVAKPLVFAAAPTLFNPFAPPVTSATQRAPPPRPLYPTAPPPPEPKRQLLIEPPRRVLHRSIGSVNVIKGYALRAPCYAAAGLQLLRSSAVFNAEVQRLADTAPLPFPGGTDEQRVMYNRAVAESRKFLLLLVRLLEGSEFDVNELLHGIPLYDALTRMAGGAENTIFHGQSQEDAGEFIQWILAAIVWISGPVSPLIVQTKRVRQCEPLHHRTEQRVEAAPFYQVMAHERGSLQDLIDIGDAGQEISGLVECEQCRSNKEATILPSLIGFSKVATITLPRFAKDYETGEWIKSTAIIGVPPSLVLRDRPELAAYSLKYNLKAVTIHRGSSMHGGHYVTIVKPHPDSDECYLYDDTQPTFQRVNFIDSLRDIQQNACAILYERE